MKKLIILSVLSFLIGIGLAAAILVNPFHWQWAYAVHHSILGMTESPQMSVAVSEGSQLWSCGMHPQVVQEEPGSCPICGMDLTPLSPPASRQLWTCGMHPEVVREEPGSCPICGMALTPVTDSGTDETGVHPGAEKPNVVRIDPAFVQNIGVETVIANRGNIPFEIRTIGNTTYNDEQVYWVNTKFEGWIEKVYVNYVGEEVKKGQKLFEIYSPQLVTTQTEYLNALDYSERMSSNPYEDIQRRASSLLQSSRQRLDYWDISEDQVAELEQTRKLRRTLTVHSPVSGLIVEKMDEALEGMYAGAGMNLYKIADLSTIWLEAEVFENQIPWLKVGSHARVEFPQIPGRTYHGRIRYIYPYFEKMSRTLKVSISLANPGLAFRKDMYANVVFRVPEALDVVTVPEEAVIFSGERNLVVISLDGGTFEVREVTVGLSGDGLFEIKNGLREGEKVVVSSQFLIDSESRLKEAIRKIVSGRQKSGGETAAEPPGDAMQQMGHQH